MTDAEKIKKIKAIEEEYRGRIRALIAEQQAIIKRAIERHERAALERIKKAIQ